MGQTSGPIGLMLAVLEEAARCIERGRRRRHPGVRKVAAEAEAWVRWDGREWSFAVANICDVLGLGVNAARLRLVGDESHATDRGRAPVWSITRGRGGTSAPPRLARRIMRRLITLAAAVVEKEVPMDFRIALAAVFVLTISSRPSPSAAQCLGDFNRDSRVTVDELITAVRNSLDDCQLLGGRFVDNGDGTVTDQTTGLVWEKKENLDGIANFSDPHDADNTYTWSGGANAPDGTVFTALLFALNGATSPDGVVTSGCFTGHCDWRLPTIEELTGIVDATQGTCANGSGPCIDPTLGPMQADGYWSATTFSRNLTTAWLMDFSSGDTARGGKDIPFFARAVRGGP